MNLTEIAYFTDDVEAMAAFYQHLLEREPVARSEGMAIFMVDHTKIFIHQSYQPGDGELPPENHTAFTLENLDQACRQLKSQGLTIQVEPQAYYWGRSAYLRDPDGNLIELNEAQASADA